MYIIKDNPQDFIVEEVPLIKPQPTGPHRYLWLKKTNYTTEKALRIVATALGINQKHLGFCGNKDKLAITTQLISIPTNKYKHITLPKDISITHHGYGNDKLRLGQLKQNTFTITVRNLPALPKLNPTPVLNLFGPQRFSKHNVEIGRSLVKQDYATCLTTLQTFEANDKAATHITTSPNDYIGAIRCYSPRKLLFYIHAYQSWLWNTVAHRITSQRTTLSILGFGSDLDEEETEAYKPILEAESISTKNFLNRSLPELNSEGTTRQLWITPQHFSVLTTGQDTESKTHFVTITFSLPPGSYATTVIDAYFSKII